MERSVAQAQAKDGSQGEAASAGAPALGGLGGGVNQAGGRAYNERLTIQLIRLNGPLPKAELARLTRLSAQTMTTIVRRLEADGLLVAQEPVRGRIGQPSTPYALAADGAFFFGVKIGRRSTEVVLCDFLGAARDHARWTHAYPEPGETLKTLEQTIQKMRRRRPGARFDGIGVAMPFELWKWAQEVDAPPGALEGWRDLDVAAELSRRAGLPAFLANDATAACGAELARHPRAASGDWLYVFIGSFVGGGVVVDGRLYPGRRGNAGALGSMPVAMDGKTTPLIQHASVLTLEKALIAEGRDPGLLQHPDRSWDGLGRTLDRWIARAGRALAQAAIAGAAVIDFERVVIDGAAPPDVLARIVAATRAHVEAAPREGLSPFEIVAGEIGADARALGGAMLAMIAAFGCDQEVLLKS